MPQSRKQNVLVSVTGLDLLIQPFNRQIDRDAAIIRAEDPQTGNVQLRQAVTRVRILAQKIWPDVLLPEASEQVVIGCLEREIRPLGVALPFSIQLA